MKNLRYVLSDGKHVNHLSRSIRVSILNSKGGQAMARKTEKERALTYTVSEVATLCGLCENNARMLINRQDCPKIRVGRRILIPKEAFHKWLNDKAFSNVASY